MKTLSTGQVFSRFSSRLWKGFLVTFFPLLFPPILQLLSPSMPLLTKYWAGHYLFISKSCAWNHLPKIGTQTHMAGTLCCALSLSCIRLGLEPGQNLWCLVLGPNNARVLDVSLQNNSVRDTVIGKRWICSDLERSTLQECGPLNVVWLVFPSSVISYANEWEDHSNNWGTTHCWVFWQWFGTVLAPLGVSFSLQTEDQGLVEFDLSSWTYLILISLCYALGLCYSFKSCALPSSLLFHALFLSPVQAHNVASTIIWRDNQKISGPWEGNTVKYPIPLEFRPSSSVFPTTCATTASLSEPTRDGWQAHNACLKSICWWDPFKGNWASRDNVFHFGS